MKSSKDCLITLRTNAPSLSLGQGTGLKPAKTPNPAKSTRQPQTRFKAMPCGTGISSGQRGDDLQQPVGTLAKVTARSYPPLRPIHFVTTGKNVTGPTHSLLNGETSKTAMSDPKFRRSSFAKNVSGAQSGSNRVVTVNFAEIEKAVVCFAAGTMIETADGERAIETLRGGDLVRTADHDYQPIRWIGSSRVAANGSGAPILIKAGALGNARDLRVSPHHRMLLGGWQTEMLFGDPEVLVAAKHLVNDQTILRLEGGTVEYFHMLFDTHEIVFAEGAPSESFHPGQIGWRGLSDAARAEILALFPELQQGQFEAYGSSARRTLLAKEARTALGLLF